MAEKELVRFPVKRREGGLVLIVRDAVLGMINDYWDFECLHQMRQKSVTLNIDNSSNSH